MLYIHICCMNYKKKSGMNNYMTSNNTSPFGNHRFLVREDFFILKF